MKYLLETDHAFYDHYLEAGTEIGDGTPYLLPEGFVPSAAMKPLDDEAKALTDKVRESKKGHWGRPEDALPLRLAPGDSHPIEGIPGHRSNAQPIIPPPLEHLTHPNTLKPGEPPKVNPLLADALEKQREENDKVMAERANEAAKARSDAVPKPAGVTEDFKSHSAPGQGPAKAPSTIPGQGPAKREPMKANPPPSKEVPRNTAGLVPENDTGERKN